MRAGFTLIKFVLNEEAAIKNVNDSDKKEGCHRVLGVQWNKWTKIFFHPTPAKFNTNAEIYTVRKLLSLIVCLFDPQVTIMPLNIALKFMLQHIWKAGLAWNERLPKKKRKLIQV